MLDWLTYGISMVDRLPAWQVGIRLMVPAALGMIVFAVLMERESHGWSHKLKYIGMIFPIIGIFICWRFSAGAFGLGELGPYYREWYGIGGRGIWLHYGAVPVQLVTLVIMAAWGIKHDRHAGTLM